MDLNPERLSRMVPSVIPDSSLAGHGTVERWMDMIIEVFKNVSMEGGGGFKLSWWVWLGVVSISM